jgi:hypothetical protein
VFAMRAHTEQNVPEHRGTRVVASLLAFPYWREQGSSLGTVCVSGRDGDGQRGITSRGE